MNTPAFHLAPKAPISPLHDGEHYRHLLYRAKRYILISFPLVLLAAMLFVFVIVRPENPELTAQALIGLESTPTKVSPLKKGMAENLGREDIMMSRTFLKEVAQNLSLQLWTVQWGRDEIFDSVRVDSSALCGTYCVRFNQRKTSQFLVSYYDTNAISLPFLGFLPGSKPPIITKGDWASGLPVHLQGMSLTFSRSIRTKPREVTFKVVDIRVAVEAVYRNLTIKRADPEKGINYIAVLMANRDYAQAAKTANTIALAFIEKNSDFRRQRALGIVGSLEKQLQLSQTNLSSAEAKVRDFHARYPQIGLTPQIQKTITRLAKLDNGIQNMSANKINAAHLRNEYLNADSSQRLQIAGVMVDLLWTNAIPVSKTLSEELNRLTVQQHAIADKYGGEHPLVLENKRALDKVSKAIAGALDDYIDNTQNALSKKQQNIAHLSSRLRQLPALQMQLGALRRNQQVFAEIYSAVLSNYSKAKMADAVETTDFYIMDYAVAPLAPPSDPNGLLILCVLIAILVSFGPVLTYDYFDKSIRSQRQLSRITGSVVLEAIPLFFPVKHNQHAHALVAHPLINVPCNPTFTRELFDSLLLKIKLRMFESTDHSIVVSSLEGGSGKSTISANLAMIFALHGHRTLLVDGDLRCGTVKEIFKLADSKGLAALLSRQNPLTDDDCAKAIVETKIPGLHVLPSGREPPNPAALLSSPRMAEFKNFCTKYMDYLVLDTPPLGVVSDAAVVQNLFAQYIFVVRSGKTRIAELVTRINEFDLLPDKILGYVLNAASPDAVGTNRRYSKYYIRTRLHPSVHRKSVIRSPAAVLTSLSIIGLVIAGIFSLPESLPLQTATIVADPLPILPALPGQAEKKASTLRNQSDMVNDTIVIDSSKKKKAETTNTVPAAASTTALKTAVNREIVDNTEPAQALLQKIRVKFIQENLSGLDSIFDKPALNDGEYYLFKARYLCATGRWREALPLAEKALTIPARAISRESLTLEYYMCKAKCLSAAFSAKPTPARGAAAMEGWYNVKYQLRGSLRGARYLYADSELRRISKEVHGQ